MGAPGRLVGICQPLAGGCVFGLAEQSGSLLWVLDGEMGSIPVTEKLHAYPSPNPKLTLTCYQLTIGGGGGLCRYSETDSDPRHVCNTFIF